LPVDSVLKRILSGILQQVASAYDLVCGTGTTVLMLAGKGIRMYAVDLSPQMCRMTREKVKRARLTLHVIGVDMRSFRLPQAVDLSHANMTRAQSRSAARRPEDGGEGRGAGAAARLPLLF